jgi:hypothetical protein
MSEQELVKTAGDLIASGAAAEVVQVIGNAGGFMLKEAGKIVLGVLIRPTIEDMIRRFRKAQADGAIPLDFEKTPHGAKLLNEALNGLLEGLDHERAKTVRAVFLGLAKTPVQDSIEQVQQIDIMRITSDLTIWEVVLVNALERYSNEVRDPTLAYQWESARDESARQEVWDYAVEKEPATAWLQQTICKGDAQCYASLSTAYDSLHSKHVLRRRFSELDGRAKECLYNRAALFTDFGWKLAVHLYSATED